MKKELSNLPQCVNLLRWSLKLAHAGFKLGTQRCKFTPMEFETSLTAASETAISGVNLLRWSLKQSKDKCKIEICIFV